MLAAAVLECNTDGADAEEGGEEGRGGIPDAAGRRRMRLAEGLRALDGRPGEALEAEWGQTLSA